MEGALPAPPTPEALSRFSRYETSETGFVGDAPSRKRGYYTNVGSANCPAQLEEVFMRNRILDLGIGVIALAGVAAFAACGSGEGPAGPEPTVSESRTAPTTDRSPTAEPEPSTSQAAAMTEPTAPAVEEPDDQPATQAGTGDDSDDTGAAESVTESGPASEGANTGSLVEPDPDWEAELASVARFSTYGWDTDFSRHTVPYSDIMSGGVPRDGIPPVYDPKHVTIEDADTWIEDQEPVVTLEIAGDARAYPLQILTWHEIANDIVGDVPVAVTFCPLCNSAIVFDRRLDGVVHTFGVSGNLRNSDLIMWDHETQTWCQQLTGEAIIGSLAGRRLSILPAPIVSYADFKQAHPDGVVLSRETGHSRAYGSNPYAGYDKVDDPPFLFRGDLDGRLLPKERVAAVTIDGVDTAFPYSVLRKEGAVNHTVGETDFVVFYKPGTVSALDSGSIPDSREVGATAVYKSDLDGQSLTFQPSGEGFVDDQTGSEWNILGEAVDGPLSGSRLEPIASADHFWFAWAAFRPDTVIVQIVN